MSEHYVVLSRKYRPKNLNDLIGQEILEKSLRSCLDTKKVPHAFLFHGIRGIGKTTTARILSRCLSCIGPDGLTDITSTPCGICRSCVALDKDQHMDIMEFDAASRTGVDDIREIIDASQYMPVLGRYKIFLIDEVHMLSKSAFNALLKTLEEPPAHVKFIFATTEIHKIPETILSRCMTFQLNPVSSEALSNHLISISTKEGFNLEKNAAEIISEESEGSVRDSLSILDQAMMLSQDTKNINPDTIINMLGGARVNDIEILLNLILKAETKEALSKSEELLQNGADPFVIYKNLQNGLYKLITEKVRNSGGVEYALSNLLYLWQIFLKQTENMKNSSYPEHVLNAAIVILAHTASFPNIEDLMIKGGSSQNNTPSLNETKKPEIAKKIEEITGNKINVVPPSKSNELVSNILNKFPGSIASEIE